MPPALRRAASIARVLLTAAVLAFVVDRLVRDWDGVRGLALAPSAGMGVAAVGLGVVAMLGLPALCVAILARLGLYRRELRWFYVRMWLQSYLYRYVPGRVLLVVERVRLGRRAGLPAAASIVVVAYETLLLLGGGALVVAAGVAFAGAGSGAPDGAGTLLWLGGIAAGVMLLGFPWLLGIATRWPAVVARFGDLRAYRLGAGAQSALMVGFAAVWLAMGGAFFACCRWFVPLGAREAPTVVFWFVASYVAGLAMPLAPAGLGVREGLLVVGLTRLVGAGPAAALAIAGRVLMTLIELACVAGAVALVRVPAKSRGDQGDAP
jgi:hypothetical protein